MIAGFYFPRGIIIRTNIEGSKENMEIVSFTTPEKRKVLTERFHKFFFESFKDNVKTDTKLF